MDDDNDDDTVILTPEDKEKLEKDLPKDASNDNEDDN